MSLAELARPEVLALPGYAVERVRDGIRLDANELAVDGPGLHRYPGSGDADLANALASHYSVAPGQVLAVRGSDDAIDALGRTFLVPGRDAVMVSPPTFEMFGLFARLQGGTVIEVPLAEDFVQDADALVRAWRPGIKLVYICSPNNPTGTVMQVADIERVCNALAGHAMVVVDEAYQEFSAQPSIIPAIARLPNLVVLRTLSKAHGLAAIRCGALLATADVVKLVRRVLPPYLLPTPTVRHALAALAPAALDATQSRVRNIVARREALARALAEIPGVAAVIPSEANFLLVRFDDAVRVHAALAARDIHVRRFEGALSVYLRITVGTLQEVDYLLEVLRA